MDYGTGLAMGARVTGRYSLATLLSPFRSSYKPVHDDTGKYHNFQLCYQHHGCTALKSVHGRRCKRLMFAKIQVRSRLMAGGDWPWPHSTP